MWRPLLPRVEGAARINRVTRGACGSQVTEGQSEYLSMIETLRRQYRVAASTTDWLGLPIVVFRVGGREEPPILVAAGATGAEPGTVYAALELVVAVDVERAVYVLPLRDPSGFHGLPFVLSRVFERPVGTVSAGEARELLRGAGAETLIDEGGAYLALYKGVGFAMAEAQDSSQAAAIVAKQLGERDLLESLDGTRIIVSTQSPQGELIGGSVTTVVQESSVATYDRLDLALPEAEFLREFLNSQELGMVMDLHEGSAPAFFAALSEEPSAGESTVLYLVIDQLERCEMRPASAEEIAAVKLTPVSNGVGYGKGFCGLVDCTAARSYAFALCAPARAPLDLRVRALVTTALSAVNAYSVARL